MKQNQSGFTLIEIAIVLVIIGLLLGGVLKGQELINSAKVKNLATDFRNVPIFVYGYQDKFRALPGDDPSAKAHVGASAVQIASTTTPSPIGNGTINGDWDATGAEESHAFWQHIRMAGLSAGPTDDPTSIDIHPLNASGGKIGISGTSPISTLSGSYVVCSSGIIGKFAKQLDITMDDSKTNAGSMMAAVAAGTAPYSPVASLDDSTPYLVCMAF